MSKPRNSTNRIPPPPIPAEPVSISEHGQTRIDAYRWLHDPDNPRVLEVLRANNEHAEAVMRARAGDIVDRLVEELAALTPPDEGVPGCAAGSYRYWKRFPKDLDYPVYLRRRLAPPGPEETILDVNELAGSAPLFVCDGVRVAPTHDRLVYAADTEGDRAYILRFRDLATGALLPDEIPGADAATAWANDGRTLFYTTLEPGTLRPYQVRRHLLGTDPAGDPVVYEEHDSAFRCLLLPTRSRRFVLLNCFANLTEEYRYLAANHPEGEFQVFCPRRAGHRYELDDDGERFLVLTNWESPDFRLCEAVVEPNSEPARWLELLPDSPGRPLDALVAFRDHVALIGFREGLQRLFVFDRRGRTLREVSFPEEVGHVWFEENPDPGARAVRVGYTSLKTPVSFYDINLETLAPALLQREEVPGFDPERYVTECRWAEARDGVRVPISLVYRRDAFDRGPAPLLLFGYGEYGVTIPVYFDQSRLALLDRGFVYAMAHIRGGGELGPAWHEAGRRRRKWTTFHDFIDCAEFLVEQGLAARGRLYAESLSSGGLVLGAVANNRPELFHGIYACMPFVDPLSTTADPALPLTIFERDEWGDPADRADWEVMRSYSPFDNVRPQAYPHMLVTAARNDSQVPCWEPVKWVARLRAANTADTQILLRTSLAAGHAGASGRRARLRDQAFFYAFFLSLAGRER